MDCEVCGTEVEGFTSDETGCRYHVCPSCSSLTVMSPDEKPSQPSEAKPPVMADGQRLSILECVVCVLDRSAKPMSVEEITAAVMRMYVRMPCTLREMSRQVEHSLHRRSDLFVTRVARWRLRDGVSFTPGSHPRIHVSDQDQTQDPTQDQQADQLSEELVVKDLLRRMRYSTDTCSECKYFTGPDYSGDPLAKSNLWLRFGDIVDIQVEDNGHCAEFVEAD